MTSQPSIRNLKLTRRTDDNDLDDDESFETEYERFTQEAEENTMRDLTERQRKMMEKKFGRFQESLKNIPSSD